MNRILLKDNSYEVIKSDDSISFNANNEFINKIKIKVNKNTKLELIYDVIDAKYDVLIEINKNVKLKLEEIKKGNKLKILHKYNLSENSGLNIIKISLLNTINEKNLVNLDKKSKYESVLKTVANSSEKYDYTINHSGKDSNSEVINNCVNKSGNIHINVSTYVPKGITGCVANQNNRIINLCNNECIIKPNLLIDEYDVVANHSALIDSFKDLEIFYMQRLGINKEIAIKLLMEGFLKNKIPTKLSNNFKKYWR